MCACRARSTITGIPSARALRAGCLLRDEHPSDGEGLKRRGLVLQPCRPSGLLPGLTTTSPSTPAVRRPALRSVTRRTLKSALARERNINFCRFLTFARFPALLAVKIRWRRAVRSPRPHASRSRASRRARPPVRSPRRMSRRPTCPSVRCLWSSSSSQAHLTASAPFRAGHKARYPAGYPRRPAGGASHHVPVSRLPFGYRHSLLGHPIPAGGLGLPHGRLTGQRPDPNGVTTFRTHELRPGWVPSLPRGWRCSSRTERSHSAGACRIYCGQSLHPAPTSIYAGLNITRHQRGFTRVHPSGLPLACGRPDATGRPWAFPRASHPADQEPDDARRGGDRPSSTDLKQRSTTSGEPPILRCLLVACDLASHRPLRKFGPYQSGARNAVKACVMCYPSCEKLKLAFAFVQLYRSVLVLRLHIQFGVVNWP